MAALNDFFFTVELEVANIFFDRQSLLFGVKLISSTQLSEEGFVVYKTLLVLTSTTHECQFQFVQHF